MGAGSTTKRSTIKDVAAQSGVSISTVSLVINDKGYVSDLTRERVRAVARRLKFVPRQAARALPSKMTGNVGFVVRDDHFRRTEPFYTGVYLGTEFEANNRELYVLLTTIPTGYVPGEHTPRFIRERNVDGILVAGKVDPAFLEEASSTGVPIVLIDFEHAALPAAIIDNRGGAHAATRHLIERGHRHIALVGADMDHPSLRARREGFQLACSEAGLAPDQLQFIVTSEGDSDYATGVVLAKRLFASESMPTAAFCINDATALAVIDQAGTLGLKVPGDIAVVGFDDVPQAEHNNPALTTVRVKTDHLGELAMRYLVDLMEESRSRKARRARDPHRITLPTELVLRDTA